MSKQTNYQETDKGAVLIFAQSKVEEVANTVKDFFTSQGYKLEEGTIQNGKYGIGNKVMRILFGAFVKRYQFNIDIAQEDENVKVTFSKSGSGVMGGAIGIMKFTKEMKRIRDLLKGI